MTDPIYDYEKGKGWVATYGPAKVKAFTYDDIEVWLIAREPANGECYTCRDKLDYPDYHTKGVPNLNMFVARVQSRTFSTLGRRSHHEDNDLGYCYVTVVPVR